MQAEKFFLVVLVLFLSVLIGCNYDDEEDSSDSFIPTEQEISDDDDDNIADDDVITDDDDDSVDDDDDLPPFTGVVYDYLMLDAEPAPPNPITGGVTPDEYNKIPFLRFRADTGDEPPRPVRYVFILLPGYSAGSSQFHHIAKDLITRTQGDMEVWVPDTRTNLLEDYWGLDAAEAEKNPKYVMDYYFDGLAVNGKTFDGWLDPFDPNLDMMSEWGLDLQMKDIRRVIEHVAEAENRANVFLGGHSNGARTVQTFAAYEFDDGVMGVDLLAGMVLYDGGERIYPNEYTEPAYLVDRQRIRDGYMARHFSQWGTPSVFFLVQFYAMLCTDGFNPDNDPQMGPDGFYPDWGLFGFLSLILTRGLDIKMTNEARWGLLLDNNYTPGINPFSGQFGQMAGGPIQWSLFGSYPSDPNATYYWINYDESDPPELMSNQELFKFTFQGPTDFGDSYFSNRLALDDDAIGEYLETEGTWVHKYFHLYTSRVDAPVIALQGKIFEDSSFYEGYRDRLPSVHGTAKPRSEEGFVIFKQPTWGHLEVLLVESDRNPWYDALLGWMDKWAKGRVQVPWFEN